MFFKLSYPYGEGIDSLMGLIGLDRRIYWYGTDVGKILGCSPYPFSHAHATHKVKDVVKYPYYMNRQLQNRRIIEHLEMMVLLDESDIDSARILLEILKDASVNVSYVKQEKITYPHRDPSPDPKFAPHLTVTDGPLNFHLWLGRYSSLILYNLNWVFNLGEARFVDYTRGLVDSPTLPEEPEEPAEPIYIDPVYSPTSPAYRPPEEPPVYSSTSPVYRPPTPEEPIYRSTSPVYRPPEEPAYRQPSPQPASPPYYSDSDCGEPLNLHDPAEPLPYFNDPAEPHEPLNLTVDPRLPELPLKKRKVNPEEPAKKRKLPEEDFGVWFDQMPPKKIIVMHGSSRIVYVKKR